MHNPRVGTIQLQTVLDAWRNRLRPAAASRPRSDERGASEEALVRVLLAEADSATVDREASLRAVVLTASAYAHDQATGRVDPAALCAQLAELREAFREELRGTVPSEDASARMRRLDRAMGLVVRASMSESCVTDLQQRGQWPDALNAILKDPQDSH